MANTIVHQVLKLGYEARDEILITPGDRNLKGVVRCNQLDLSDSERGEFEAHVLQLGLQGLTKQLFIGYIGADHGLSYCLTSSGINMYEDKELLGRRFPLPQSEDVFVIMSFSNNATLVDANATIKRVCSQFGLTSFRVDEIEENRRITDVVLECIQTCRFMIADVTEERPNVYYELGYAHALGKEVIQICHSGSNLHFDIKDYPTILYESQAELERRLSSRVAATLKKRLDSLSL